MADRASLPLVFISAAIVVIASARVGDVDAPAPVAASLSAQAAAPVATVTSTPSSSARWPRVDPDDEASCAIPDRGPGLFGDDWTKLPVGRMLVPQTPPREHYDLVLHLHGGEAARRVVAPLERPELVLVAVDAGVGSKAYAEVFYGADPLQKILGAVDDALKPAKIRQLVVTSWSAGYGGVREILKSHPTTAGAIVLLDSVHAGYEADGETLVPEGLMPFYSFATRATQGEARMVLTHSAIRPPGYASTSEVAAWLLAKLGARKKYAGLLPAHGVELKTRYDEGRLSVRGFTGKGKPAHCAHLMMLPEILQQEIFVE